MLISDDHIERMLAELNRSFNAGTSNEARGESLVNKQALDSFKPIRHGDASTRAAAEQLIFSRKVTVCSCVYQLGGSLRQDVDAAVAYAVKDSNLSVELAPIVDNAPTSTVSLGLPGTIVDILKVFTTPQESPSKELLLHTCLERAQRHLNGCTCGSLTG